MIEYFLLIFNYHTCSERSSRCWYVNCLIVPSVCWCAAIRIAPPHGSDSGSTITVVPKRQSAPIVREELGGGMLIAWFSIWCPFCCWGTANSAVRYRRGSPTRIFHQVNYSNSENNPHCTVQLGWRYVNCLIQYMMSLLLLMCNFGSHVAWGF